MQLLWSAECLSLNDVNRNWECSTPCRTGPFVCKSFRAGSYSLALPFCHLAPSMFMVSHTLLTLFSCSPSWQHFYWIYQDKDFSASYLITPYLGIVDTKLPYTLKIHVLVCKKDRNNHLSYKMHKILCQEVRAVLNTSSLNNQTSTSRKIIWTTKSKRPNAVCMLCVELGRKFSNLKNIFKILNIFPHLK